MFSKIFASSSQIGGWKELLDTYWLGHHTEPFATTWAGIKNLEYRDFDGFDYWVTSISIPFIKNGELEIPDISGFRQQAESLGLETCVGVISRDINILKYQQTRVRGTPTLNTFLDQLATLGDVTFLSHESVTLYGKHYLDKICDQIGFPHCEIPEMGNANEKYVKYVENYDLDIDVHNATEESRDFHKN